MNTPSGVEWVECTEAKIIRLTMFIAALHGSSMKRKYINHGKLYSTFMLQLPNLYIPLLHVQQIEHAIVEDIQLKKNPNEIINKCN